MTIYIDSDFKCHTQPGEGRAAVVSDFFDGKCAAFVEGYRFVPTGQTWTRADGVEFAGEMIAPFKAFGELERAQIAHEKQQYEAAIDELLIKTQVAQQPTATVELLPSEREQYETAIDELLLLIG